ncbi:hypothetical protein SAMN05192540_1563 [Maribacter dokdonensis]|uniref:Helix-turn-helix domain-containing protein n=2 Tax=Maribacter dokdonensis TaxID=320912 RepID=A0A1H4M9I0_9FLAO|nr:hypothetical protein SAMN05192540_1563 [Maribacter dokdonensis]
MRRMQVINDFANSFLRLFSGHGSKRCLHIMSYSKSNPFANIFASLPTALQMQMEEGSNKPQRKFTKKPDDNGSYILPLKQSFMKDVRLMPGTRCMISLLVGWAGQGRDLNLTQGTIAKHIGRSVRQVYRYLKDAAEEGYLTYNYTKNRIGMITGIKVFLSFDLLRPTIKKRKFQARTQGANTNTYLNKIIKKEEMSKPERTYLDNIEAIAARNSISLE